jgi:hypothetical protein
VVSKYVDGLVGSRVARWAARRVCGGPGWCPSLRCRPRGGCWCLRAAHLRQPERQGGACFCSARPPASSATSTAWPLNAPGSSRRSRAGRSRKRASSAREESPTPARGAAPDAGREDPAMTAQTGGIDAAFGWSGHRLREGRGASCRGGWRHPERGVARAELRDGHPPRRRDYTYPRWRNRYGGLKGGRRQGPVRPGRPLGTGLAGANRRRNAPQQDYELEPTSLRRVAVLRTGD